MAILAPNENNFWQRKNITKWRNKVKVLLNPYVSEVQATSRSGFAVRAPVPILIQQQRSFTDLLFQIDDTDDVDSDVPVEMA